jgi:hypothetical protein
MLKNRFHNRSTTSHNQHEKQLPQPLLQPNKPQITKQTKNTAQNTTAQPTCAQKTHNHNQKKNTTAELQQAVSS